MRQKIDRFSPSATEREPSWFFFSSLPENSPEFKFLPEVLLLLPSRPPALGAVEQREPHSASRPPRDSASPSRPPPMLLELAEDALGVVEPREHHPASPDLAEGHEYKISKISKITSN